MPNCSAAAWSNPRSPEELAGGDGLGRRQLVGVERLGGLVGLDQPLALRPARPVVADVALLAAQVTPYLSASRSTASVKESPSIFIRKEMTSPPSPHAPKQCQRLRDGVTWNDGDFSSWKGHRPFSEPPPALRRVT